MSLGNLPKKAHVGIALLVAIGFFAFIQIGINQTAAWEQEGAGGAEDFETLAEALFTDHVLALEALGVLLTAAMIGAMIIARPLGTIDDATNYPTKRGGGRITEIQEISDVDANLAGVTFTPTPISEINGGEEE